MFLLLTEVGGRYRFKGQKSSRPIAFKLAIEEAILEEFGIEQCQYISQSQLPSKNWKNICKPIDVITQSDLRTPSEQLRKVGMFLNILL